MGATSFKQTIVSLLNLELFNKGLVTQRGKLNKLAVNRRLKNQQALHANNKEHNVRNVERDLKHKMWHLMAFDMPARRLFSIFYFSFFSY